jgi:hypothetical protein
MANHAKWKIYGANGYTEVRNAAGEKRTARLETANGYWLTVNGTLMAVEFLLKNALPGGYYTPSMLMGSRCIHWKLDQPPFLPDNTMIPRSTSRGDHRGSPANACTSPD